MRAVVVGDRLRDECRDIGRMRTIGGRVRRARRVDAAGGIRRGGLVGGGAVRTEALDGRDCERPVCETDVRAFVMAACPEVSRNGTTVYVL